ncbi:MAG: terminase family protein [Blastocatellia bacterium]
MSLKASQTIKISLSQLHAGQEKVNKEAKRFNVLACGRRFGKTKFGIDRIIHPVLQGYPVGWFAPTYRNLAEVWIETTKILQPITLRKNASDHRIEVLGGGVIEMWSLDRADIIRGRKYKRAAIDEAGFVKNLQECWQQVIRPTLADFSGDAWFFGTPKGHNYFYNLFNYGLDPLKENWACWQMSTSTNPFIPASEVKELEQELPSRVYAQEILAEFLPDGGAIFRGVVAAATAKEQEQAVNGHVYIFGVDIGRKNDFTVIAVIDLTTSELVKLDRFTNVEFEIQLNRLQALYQRFKPVTIIAEQNNFGMPMVERMVRLGLPVRPWTTTNATKAAAVDALTLAFEFNQLRILNDQVLIHELQAFEGEQLKSGLIRYGATDGENDDTVIALMLAWQGCIGLVGTGVSVAKQVTPLSLLGYGFLSFETSEKIAAFATVVFHEGCFVSEVAKLLPNSPEEIIDCILAEERHIPVIQADEAAYNLIANEWRNRVNTIIRSKPEMADRLPRLRLTKRQPTNKEVNLNAIEGAVETAKQFRR